MSDLRELLEARRAIADAMDVEPQPWEVIPITGTITESAQRFITSNDPHTVALYIDLALAAERRRQAAEMFAKADPGTQPHRAWKVAYEDAENAEDAALDRLAVHLRGGVA